MTKKTRTLTVKRMTSVIQRRLDAFGFRVVWVRFEHGQTVIGYI